MSPENLLTEWAGLLIESFATAGVRDAVISPGSRSTPFVYAAGRHPRLTCHSVVDERSAGFFALGQARATGRPSLLVSTSGTAAANYLPAVVEAAASFTPLLVLTADRPVELADCGAPQTIDQVKLFGGFARRFFDLGAPEPGEGALRALRRTAFQAHALSLGPEPGAVHLNARAAKPLEPVAADGGNDEAAALAERARRVASRPQLTSPPPRRLPDPEALRAVAAACRQASRGLVVCGPAPLSRVRDREAILGLARAAGFPLLAETTSQLRFLPAGLGEGVCRVSAFDALLHAPGFRERTAPEVVLQLGPAPTSGTWEGYLAEHPDCRRFVLAEHGWPDPASAAEGMIHGDLGATVAALSEELAKEEKANEKANGAQRAGRDSWCKAWEAAEGTAREALAAALGETGEPLSEGAAAHELAAALPPGSLLGVGNSLPIREVETWAPAAGRDLAVWCQRGANGIDGVLSGFAGSAGRFPGSGPAALVVGDLSFLHDLGGLACWRLLERPAALVVVNNDGGRIFEQLPIAGALSDAEASLLDLWLTPHGLDLEPAARLYRLPYARAATVSELRRALEMAFATKGATVLEVVAPGGLDQGAAARNRRLYQQLERRLEARGDLP